MNEGSISYGSDKLNNQHGANKWSQMSRFGLDCGIKRNV